MGKPYNQGMGRLMTSKAKDLRNRKNRLNSFGWEENPHGIGRHGHYWTHEQVPQRCTLRQAEEIQQSFEKNANIELLEELQGMKARISSLERSLYKLQEQVRTNESVRNPTREY